MAYGDSGSRFWQIDLTTRAGARSAAQQGAIACFVFCGMAVLGAVLLGGVAGYSTAQGLSLLIGAGIEAVIGLIAGLRMRAGKGAWWGIAAAVLTALELAAKVAAVSIGGIFLTGAVLIMIVQGVRAAFALRSAKGFGDDDAETFY